MKLDEPLIPRYARWRLLGCLGSQLLVYFCTKPWAGRSFVDISTPLDARIPLAAWWVTIYIGAFLFWAVGYIQVFRRGEEHGLRLFAADLTGKAIAAVIFLAMPTMMVRPEPPEGVWGRLLGVIYFLDSPYNLFPSLHCFNSWLVFRSVLRIRDVRGIWKWLAGLTCVLIFLSTLFTRQHVVLDIAGGVALAETALFISDLIARRRTRT